jgi:zinc transporter, ZIP family
MSAAVLTAKDWIAAEGNPRQRWVRTLGLLIAATGLVAMTANGVQAAAGWLQANPGIRLALLATLFTAGATALGALPVLVARKVSQKALDAMLGFGAGVMLAATAFSLLIPGIEAGTALAGNNVLGVSMVGFGLAAGGLLLLALDRAVPHEHFVKGVEGQRGTELKRIWLFVAAIALHNVPEGLAVGVGFAGGEAGAGVPLALGIALQNAPEGLIVALALAAVGYSRLFAAGAAALTGLLEPVGGVIGAAVVGASEAMLPWGLGFAAGAMLFVISHEIIPESHRKGHERAATVGLLGGFVLMMMLDTALG